MAFQLKIKWNHPSADPNEIICHLIFLVSFLYWTIVWLVSRIIEKKNPLKDLWRIYGKSYGLEMVVGVAAITLLSSWLIYELPVTTIAILSTLSFPVSYFFSRFKYKENITMRMWLGVFFIITAMVFFFFV